MTNQTLNNNCLIDYLRFSVPNSARNDVIQNVLCIPSFDFSQPFKGSPYPTYDEKISFANIDIHSSKSHDNILIDMSGQA
ncbi:MAG: replication initiation factor domain-containing protein, partial [Culicoidibacterales bacterium]